MPYHLGGGDFAQEYKVKPGRCKGRSAIVSSLVVRMFNEADC